MIQKIYNLVNLCGWAYVFHLTGTNNINTSTELLHTVSIVQCFAIMEPILVFCRVVNSSLPLTIVQLMSRLIFPCWFFELHYSDHTDTAQLDLALQIMCIAWSMTEVVRSLFYITKYRIFAWLRYNLFIVLYPMGVFGELFYISTILL